MGGSGYLPEEAIMYAHNNKKGFKSQDRSSIHLKLTLPGYNCHCCLVAESCLTLRWPMDCSPPGSSAQEILHARILQWVAISYSRGSSRPRGQTLISWVSCIGRLVLDQLSHQGKPEIEKTIQMRTKASSLKLAAGKKSTSIFASGWDSKAGRITGKSQWRKGEGFKCVLTAGLAWGKLEVG